MAMAVPSVERFQSIFELTSAGAVVAATIAGALAVALQFFRSKSSIHAAKLTDIEVGALREIPPAPDKPFEATALANYYNQALSRANISFWFSLVFASIGFGVIIFAFISHSSGQLADTAIKVASGAVIDAVSSLFFIQSTNAQKAMQGFFEKLRLDRLNAEAKQMIESVENAERRDQLRAQMILKFAAIDKLIIGTPDTLQASA
jgi:hypothetical protein